MVLQIVDRNNDLNASLQALLERRLHFALSRFATRIEGVGVVVEEVDGPRGGSDKSCRLAISLRGARDVVICDQDANLSKCISRTAARAGRAVSRSVEMSLLASSRQRPNLESADRR